MNFRSAWKTCGAGVWISGPSAKSIYNRQSFYSLEWGGKVGSHVNLVVDDFQTFPKNGGWGSYFVTAKVSEDQSCPLREVAA